MSTGNTRTDILHDKLLAEVRRALEDCPRGERAAMRASFAAKSEDYRTLSLMHEMPAHANAAADAWREIAPTDDVPCDQRLLLLLADVYAHAAGHGHRRPGNGQAWAGQ